MYNGGGGAKGLYPLLIKAAFDRMGVPVVLQTAPWRRALTSSLEEAIGIGGIYVNSDRLTKYDYSDPIFHEELMLYTVPEKLFSFETLDDLAGKTIGGMRGWSYGDAFDQARAAGKFKVEEVSKDEQNVGKLVVGRLDAIISTRECLDVLRQTMSREIGSLILLPKPLISNATYLAFSKAQHKAYLLTQFNVALIQMRQDGLYQKLTKEAFSE
ncbi:hypothetical protein CCP2SC5_770001 [Azospirillaceae bacterium]